MMIVKAKIEELVKELLSEDMFLVEADVSTSNVIKVFIDSYEGLTIEDCVALHRELEQKLDREEEDFELEVSSPGLLEGFKVKDQYLKNTGRQLEVVTNDGTNVIGILKEAGDDYFTIESSVKQKVEGHKKKQVVVNMNRFYYHEIKSAKVIVTLNKLKRDGKY